MRGSKYLTKDGKVDHHPTKKRILRYSETRTFLNPIAAHHRIYLPNLQV